MARLKFKRFSDLAFLQGIDKPKYLAPLLLPFADYFQNQGLDVSKLTNSDAMDRKLLEIFTNLDEEMPGGLLEILYAIDDLADDPGRDRILNEIERRGAVIEGLSDEMTPGEYAIAVYRAIPRLLKACHEKIVNRKIKNYTEYQSKSDRRLAFTSVKKNKAVLEGGLAEWFGKQDRGKVCEIFPYEEGPEIRLIVTHGLPYCSKGTIDKRLKRSRTTYRPQKHDSLIYDTRTGILKVNAQTLPEREEYRKQFGQVFFNDAEHFPAGDIYTLAPIKAADFRLRVPNGIIWANVCEVWIEIQDEQNIVQITRGFDLLGSATGRTRLNLEEGEIKRVAFKVKYESGGKPRKLEIRPSNLAIYDRDRDGAAAESFLSLNRFLKIEQEWPTPQLT